MNIMMKRIAKNGFLIFFMLMALPISAQQNKDVREMQKACMRFLNDKHVTLTNPLLTSHGQPIDKKSIHEKDSTKHVDFTCTDAKVLNLLLLAFMGHFDNATFHYCYSLASKIENSEILKFSNDGSYLLLTSRENVYVLTFEESDNLSYGFCLMWDNLPDGSKKGYLVQHVGKDPKVLKLAKEEDRTTMDSVRTAIKIGEEVQSELQSINGDAQKEIDTTYIDGKWAVTSKYHRDILRAMDHISDYQDGFPALHNKVQELVEHSKDASEVQLASIGFALKREASRYELLLTPEQFALLWGGIYKMENKAKNADPQIQDYFKASENILRGKINESVRLEYHDAKRHQFLKDIGFTVTKNEGGRWYYAVSGKHYTGNPDLEYLDGCCDEDGALKYTAEHVETNLKPGIYRVTVAGRASGHGESGAFIFAKTREDTLLKEIPACDDRGGDIWQQAAIRVKEADEKGTQISPKDVRIALANGGMGYGWSRIVIDNIVVRDGNLTYGVTCDPNLTGKTLKRRWLSAVDFVLERVGDLPKE